MIRATCIPAGSQRVIAACNRCPGEPSSPARFLHALLSQYLACRHKPVQAISTTPIFSGMAPPSGKGRNPPSPPKKGFKRKVAGNKWQTHNPPCQLPRPLIASACTLVIRNRFSVSDKFAASCSSCQCSCACAAWVSTSRISPNREQGGKEKKTGAGFGNQNQTPPPPPK